MEMEMEMNQGNYSDESTVTSDSSGGSGGSFSPPLKRLCKVKTDMTTTTTTTTTDDDTDSKTSSIRSSISEEFGGPHLLQPSDPLQQIVRMKSSISEEFSGPYPLQPSDPEQQTAVGEEIGKRCSTLEELATNEYTSEECKDFVRTIDSRPDLDSQTEIEIRRGEEYIYFGPRSMCLCSLPGSEYKVTHINFFARRLGEKQESLLFAALEHGPVRKVLECCTVPLFKAGDGVVPCIKHPPNVDCSECSKFGDAALCFEVQEEPCCVSWSCSWPSA